MSSRLVYARWAIVGKLPGDRGDYGILRQGRRHDEDDGANLAQFIWAAVPGTPQLGNLPGAGSLPWVAFVPRGEGGQRWLTVTVVDPTKDRDAVGRPNIAIRHVAMSFAEIAARGTGYAALYAAIPPADEFPRTDGSPDATGPLPLTLPDPGTATGTELADQEVFRQAAALAADLLCEQVVITLTDEVALSLPERLALLDRVTALLPFGMRAGLAMASWHDGTKARPFRLAFGPYAARGEIEARHGQPVPPPTAGIARDYWRSLARLRGRLGVAGLVEHLGRYRQPLAPGDGEGAVQILRSLAEPELVVAAARAGRVSLERVVNTRRHNAYHLDRDSLDALEIFLMARSETDDEIRAGWSDRSAALAARLVLSEVAANGVAEAGGSARRLYALAAERGDAERFLTTIAGRKTLDGQVVHSSSVARLIRGLAKPDRGELPDVRHAVLRQPQVARWLIRQSLRGSAWVRWLEWIDPGSETAPGWLGPYRGLSTRFDLPVAWADGVPADADPEDMALTARLAYRNGRPAPVTAKWWATLHTLARSQQDEPPGNCARADLIDLLEGLDDAATDADTAVRLDTLRLYLELAPRHFPLAGAPLSECRDYLDLLWDLWSRAPIGEDFPVLVSRLVVALLPVPGSPGQAPVDQLVTVLLAVVGDDRIPLDQAIADLIAGACAAVPALLDDPRLTADWWTRVEHLLPALREPSARLRAAVRQPGADPVDVAVLWGKAAAGDADRQDLLSIACPWLADRTPAEISAVLKILDGVLGLAPDGAGTPAVRRDYVLRTVADLIGTGLPGPAARNYADYETERVVADSRFLRHLRRVISRHRPR